MTDQQVLPFRRPAETTPPRQQRCWTVPELAAYLQVSRRTISTWISQKRLRAHRLSGTVTVIEPREVERFLDAHATGRDV